jgi:hypothetical protein
MVLNTLSSIWQSLTVQVLPQSEGRRAKIICFVAGAVLFVILGAEFWVADEVLRKGSVFPDHLHWHGHT